MLHYKKGSYFIVDEKTYLRRKDYWGFYIGGRENFLKFRERILPYMRHPEKIEAALQITP